MKALFIALPMPPKPQTILGISERMDRWEPFIGTLPAVYEPVEVYAVRCSEGLIEEVRELLSREHTAGRALGLLRSRAHSFTYVGNA